MTNHKQILFNANKAFQNCILFEFLKLIKQSWPEKIFPLMIAQLYTKLTSFSAAHSALTTKQQKHDRFTTTCQTLQFLRIHIHPYITHEYLKYSKHSISFSFRSLLMCGPELNHTQCCMRSNPDGASRLKSRPQRALYVLQVEPLVAPPMRGCLTRIKLECTLYQLV